MIRQIERLAKALRCNETDIVHIASWEWGGAEVSDATRDEVIAARWRERQR